MISAPRRFVVAFAASAALLLVPAILVSLYIGPVEGDLARVGHFAQRDFAALPQSTAPGLLSAPIERLPAPPLAAPADIVLIGDSFSQPNLWQSELARITGKSVATWHFRMVDCTGDWIERAIAGTLRQGAKTVIVETVEREFFKRFEDEPQCAKKFYPPLDVAVGMPRPVRGWNIFPMDIRHVAKSALQYWQTRGISGRYESGGVVSVDLVRGDLFSNKLSSRLLYFGEDEFKLKRWSEPEAAALLARFVEWRSRAAAAGIQLHFLVVPDKSSVYWPHIRPDQQIPYPDKGERLFALIEKDLGAQYNLLPRMREQAVQQRDFYSPNDSHFSARGFRLLATLVAGWMAAAPAPPVTGARSSGT